MMDKLYKIAVIATILIAFTSVVLVVDARRSTVIKQLGGTDSTVEGIEKDVVIEQRLLLENDIYSIESFQLRIGTYVRNNNAILEVRFLDENKRVLQSWGYATSGLWDGSYIGFKLNKPYKGKESYLQVRSNADENNAVTLFCSSGDSYIGELAKSGERLPGDLLIKISGRQHPLNYLKLTVVNGGALLFITLLLPRITKYFKTPEALNEVV